MRTLSIAVILLFAQMQVITRHHRQVTAAPVTPASLSGLQGWWSADCYAVTGSTCSTPSAGTLSTNWDCNAGFSGCGSSSTGTAQLNGTCTFVTSAINGKPAVSFDGSSCYFYFAGSGVLSTTYTAFVVMANASGTAKSFILGGFTNSFAYKTADGAPNEQGLDAQSAAGIAEGTAALDTSWHQMNVTTTGVSSGGNTYSFRLDEASDGSGTSSSSNTYSGHVQTIGRNQQSGNGYIKGEIAEVFFYNRVLTNTEIGQMETYLNGKYGI